MRRTFMGLAGGLAALTLVACGTNDPSGTHAQPSADNSADGPPAALKPAAEKPAAEKPAAQKPAAQKPIVVRGEGALIRPYAAKSLRDFAADPYVVAVVRGTVTGVESRASDVGYVTSIVTVAVQRGLGQKAGSTVQVSEPGGVVPMSEVRSDFEGKEWQDQLAAADLSRMVDYQMEGFPHSHVGDDVVMFLADGSDDGAYTLAAKLVSNGANFRFQNDEAPNPSWDQDGFSSAAVDAMVEASAK